VKESFEADEEIFDSLIKDSKEVAKAGAELVVWPETMVPGILNPKAWSFLMSPQMSKSFDSMIKEHSFKDKTYVLVGASGVEPKIQSDGSFVFERYNSAFLYLPDGSQSDKQYNKIHLVPFGEVVPFKKSAPWLHRILMKFTPYDYDYTLDYGNEYTVFQINSNAGEKEQIYKFGVMICYEDTVPIIARRFAIDEKGQKKVDWLLNISNDGWFTRFKGKDVFASTELGQHTAICAFRAVETRLAVLRSVNTGISCLIDTCGRIKNGYMAGNLPNKAMSRKGMSGWLVDKIPIDKRVTFFSKYGQWLDFCCIAGFCFPIVVTALKRFAKTSKNAQKNEKNA